MTFPTPPRGRHWRNQAPAPDAADPTPRSRFQVGGAPAGPGNDLPRAPTPDVVEDVGGGRDYRTGYDPGDHLRALRVKVPADPHPGGDRRAVDLVVPRVYLEPDERLDSLRRKAFRVAIVRDVAVTILAVYFLGRLLVRPLLTALGF